MNRPSQPWDKAFGKRLLAELKRRGLSQVAFAKRAGLSSQTVNRYVRGAQAPAGEEMIKLARALGGRFLWVLTGDDPTMALWLQDVMDIGVTLTDDLPEVLGRCARILASGHHDAIITLSMITALIDFSLNEGREIADDTPDEPSGD